MPPHHRGPSGPSLKMCGIAGICNMDGASGVPADTLSDMVRALAHRGPDGFGIYRDEKTGLAHARLAIIDVAGGAQPMANEDKTVWITLNGEIFNYMEIREALLEKGHLFRTDSDTEVIVHLYEEYGTGCLSHLNGQYAFALWDKVNQRLLLARDRAGVRPLFYTRAGGSLIFASEIKSVFMDRRVGRSLDLRALSQVFTFWTTISPRTAFENIFELPPAHYMTAEKGRIKIERYWRPDFTPRQTLKSGPEYAECLRGLLDDATRLRLRSDVPVGTYLSGGIDSSVVTAIAQKYAGPESRLRAFSVAFEDSAYDESAYQEMAANHLRVGLSRVRLSAADVGSAFPKAIWHAEKPVVRTAPAPFFFLSGLARAEGYKVVLTGEGADEVLAGYDIFKEAKIREFIGRCPGSRSRSALLKRLYPYHVNSPVRSLSYAQTFFGAGFGSWPEQWSSHFARWSLGLRTSRFFSDSLKDQLCGYDVRPEMEALFDHDMSGWGALSRAQYIEFTTLLPGYILSSQGDRMAMAHSVEGRFPFLDHRIMEFCAGLPPNLRMNALAEKYLLRESMKGLLPETIMKRAKRPYMAPDARSFFAAPAGYVEGLLSGDNLRSTGLFNAGAVQALVKKCRTSPVLGFKDNMAITGIISTLILNRLFVEDFESESRNFMEGNPIADKAGDKTVHSR